MTFDEFLKEQLNDPEFAQEWEKLQAEHRLKLAKIDSGAADD